MNPELAFDDFEGNQNLVTYKCEDIVKVKVVHDLQFKVLQVIEADKSLIKAFQTLENLKLIISPEDWSEIFSVFNYCKRM